MRAKAETFAQYHDEHARYGGASRDFHALAGAFLRDLAEQHNGARARVAALETLVAELVTALTEVLASAHPHPVDHPAMTSAWALARAAIAKAKEAANGTR